MKMTTRLYIVLFLWCMAFSKAVMAATSGTPAYSFDFKNWDYESLLWAAIAGMLGGALRTIYTLASTDKVVYRIVREAWKDLIVSFITGGAAYVLIIAVSSKSPDLITREIRMALIVAAGWAPKFAAGWVERLVAARLTKAERDTSGGQPPAPPLSDVVPLSVQETVK